MSFRKVLVANRGEIACRVIRTLNALGIPSCAVFSEADRDAPHVGLAGESVLLGAAEPRESYLAVQKVVEAAKRHGCDALHPGYGFLSENADLAEACAEAGVRFVGPSPEVIRSMGDKARARRLAEEAGVAPVPGYEGADDDDQSLAREAERIGFPLLVKAAHGGGGKGMRKVDRAEDLAGALAGARREATAAFGRAELILERFVRPARHVEVQIFGDGRGKAWALLERECSLQRRHQKVIEECPSPAVDPELRERLGAAAVKLAEAVSYEGAGTVEFLLAEDRSFYFLEMNTRLQVEHGVTELVLGLDLVALQLAVAAGDPLPADLDRIEPRGHALEARVYAEDPEHGFLPQTGVIQGLRLPAGPGIRVDAGIAEGQVIGPHYDPMLLKLMASGRDREEARRRLAAALRELRVGGLVTNAGYLLDILAEEDFARGRTFTHSLESREGPAAATLPPEVLWLAAAALSAPARAAGPSGAGPVIPDPFQTLGPLRLVPLGDAP